MSGHVSKIMVTGGEGMVGSYIDFGITTNSKELDVTNIDSVRENFEKHKPKVVIHLAAMTNVDECENNPKDAYNVNATGTYNVALIAREYEAKMIYVSTNAVFSGTDETPYTFKSGPNPTNVYGHSKYAGELIVRSLSKESLIIRTSWIFGGGPTKDKKFVSKIIQKIRSGETVIQAINDCRGTPTFAKDLVDAIIKLIKDKRVGIIHCVNAGNASRYDMANNIVTAMNSPITVHSTPVQNFKINPPPPRNEMLKSDFKMRTWQEALKEYLNDEWL